MCANYRPSSRDYVLSLIHGELPGDYASEAWPGSLAPLIRRDGESGQVIAEIGRFGLLPHFAKDLSYCKSTYNARSETVAEKPSFRLAWKKAQFCIIPVQRFYEPNYETGRAIRWSIGMGDGSDFGIAGLWSHWRDPASKKNESSFTMLTQNADTHPLMCRFHKPVDEKRMPYILRPADFDLWINATPDEARALISPIQAELLDAEAAPLVRRKPSVLKQPETVLT